MSGFKEAPVSVLMATFNRSRYIGSALQAIVSQTRAPRQIIVIDDGSTDATAEIVRPFLQHITYLRQENAGKSAALNRALPMVTEEFTWIFDDDDVPFPNALERHLEALDRNPSSGFTYSPLVKATTIADERLQPIGMEPFPELKPTELFPRLLESCFITQQGSLARTSCFQAVGSFREDLLRSLDYEYLLRMARHFSGVRLDEPTFYLRIHPGVRGPASNPIQEHERSMRWYRANQVIFRELHASLKLWEYLPHMPGTSQPDKCDLTHARLARMVVMAQKGLWEEAIDDMKTLIEECDIQRIPANGLYASLERAMDSQLAVRELVGSETTLKQWTNIVREIGNIDARIVCARKLYHHISAEKRANNLKNVSLILRAIYLLAGPDGIASVALRKLRGHSLVER